MPDNTRTKTASYRRCAITSTAGGSTLLPSLEDLIRKATKNVKRPWQRQTDRVIPVMHLLAETTTKSNCFCGKLVLFEKGKKVPLVDTKNDGSTWEGAVEPKDDDGNKRNLEQNAFFFAVKENHVAIIQSLGLSINAFEKFIEWFIVEKAKLISDVEFELRNIPSKSAAEKIKSKKIKGIKIGKNVFENPKTNENKKSKTKTLCQTLKTDPKWLVALQDFFKIDRALIDELQKSSEPENIFMQLFIRYQSRKPAEAQQVMKSIAATVGDNPDLNAEITLEGNEKIKGDELTIKGTLKIQSPNGILASDDAMSKLAEWLINSISNNVIPL